MHAIKVYISGEEFDQFIKEHLDQRDAERFAECQWVPVKIEVTDLLNIEALVIPAR